MGKIFKKNKIIIKKNHGLPAQTGYIVLELLFYIAFFSVLSLVVINAMIIMARSFKETTIQAELVQSGYIMEKISREIRQAYDIDATSTSTDLKLNTKDNDGVNKIIEFKFVDSNIQLWDAGSNIGNLNTPNIAITGITFTQITTAKGKAVRIVLTLRSINNLSGNTEDFYNTVVLRGSY